MSLIPVFGMANLGSTCWMNSVLQCLFHCPAIMEYMHTFNVDDAAEEVTTVVDAFLSIARSSGNKAAIQTFKDLIPHSFTATSNSKLQDSHEFLLKFFAHISTNQSALAPWCFELCPRSSCKCRNNTEAHTVLSIYTTDGLNKLFNSHGEVCITCGESTTSTKGVKTPPKIFTVHFARWINKMKSNAAFDFSLEFTAAVSESQSTVAYDLVATVNHISKVPPLDDHYVSYVKWQDKWWRISDLDVKPDPCPIDNEAKTTAYLLFYALRENNVSSAVGSSSTTSLPKADPDAAQSPIVGATVVPALDSKDRRQDDGVLVHNFLQTTSSTKQSRDATPSSNGYRVQDYVFVRLMVGMWCFEEGSHRFIVEEAMEDIATWTEVNGELRLIQIKREQDFETASFLKTLGPALTTFKNYKASVMYEYWAAKPPKNKEMGHWFRQELTDADYPSIRKQFNKICSDWASYDDPCAVREFTSRYFKIKQLPTYAKLLEDAQQLISASTNLGYRDAKIVVAALLLYMQEKSMRAEEEKKTLKLKSADAIKLRTISREEIQAEMAELLSDRSNARWKKAQLEADRMDYLLTIDDRLQEIADIRAGEASVEVQSDLIKGIVGRMLSSYRFVSKSVQELEHAQAAQDGEHDHEAVQEQKLDIVDTLRKAGKGTPHNEAIDAISQTAAALELQNAYEVAYDDAMRGSKKKGRSHSRKRK